MKYAYTIMYVKNVEATITFYTAAFGFKKKFITPDKDYGEIISGETTIAFATIALGKTNVENGFIESDKTQKPFGIELAFTTENIETDFKKAIEAGAQKIANIKTKPWGQKVGYLRDNNGFLIEICTPMHS